MSVTVELSELDADLWDAFRRGDGWVAASEYRKLMAQNHKLRELVRDIHALGWSGFDCTECPRSFSERCIEGGGCPLVSTLTDRMRELGVDA